MERLDKILSRLSHLNLEGQIVDKSCVSKLGGSCDVFRAWSNKHGKKVAVKQIREFMSDNESFAKRLAKEIRVWTKLKHENVLPLLGYFIVGKNKMPSMVSEWMEDGTMTEYMKTFDRCSIETLRMLVGIASGLAYLHERDVIHADLKSANILISSNGTPLLTDFGLSLVLCQTQSTTQRALTTSTAMLGGTVRWMARELFASKSDGTLQRHDRATDIWAYGMVVYVCDPCSNLRFQCNFKLDVPLGTAYPEGSVCR